jgi:hypothetical protein
MRQRAAKESTPPRPVDSTALLAAVAAALWLLNTWQFIDAKTGVDFYQFWVVSQAVGESRDADVYSQTARQSLGQSFLERAHADGGTRRQEAAEYRQVLETYSTPFLYTVFRLFSWGDYDRDYRVFQLFSEAAAIAALLMLVRLLGYSPRTAVPALLVLVGWGGPFFWDTAAGNVNRLQVGLIGLFLWSTSRAASARRDVTSGVILGLAVMFKPNLLFVVLALQAAWLMDRRFAKWRNATVGLTAAVVGAYLVSALYFGSWGCWLDWLRALGAMSDDVIPLELGNYALSRLLLEKLGLRMSWILTAALLVLAGALLWKTRRAAAAPPPRPDDELIADGLAVALGVLVSLLSAPLVWGHYLFLAAPAILIVLRPSAEATRSRTLAAIALLMIATSPALLPQLLMHATTAALLSIALLILLTAVTGDLRRLSSRP